MREIIPAERRIETRSSRSGPNRATGAETSRKNRLVEGLRPCTNENPERCSVTRREPCRNEFVHRCVRSLSIPIRCRTCHNTRMESARWERP